MTHAPTAMYHDDDQIVTDIRNLLEHGYHEESFIREMMQNADDAGARSLHFAFRPDGIGSGATNPLLQGPLLLIANDGELTQSDEDALYRAKGGNKAEDEAKVGRFGLGLKSIFHWCEAFIYCAISPGTSPRVGVVNPYVRKDGQDPVNPDWQAVSDNEVELLSFELRNLLAAESTGANGLLLCAPLRTKVHLNRGDLRLADCEWPVERCPAPKLFELNRAGAGAPNSAPLLPELVLVLAQCGHLDRVLGTWPEGGFSVRRRDGQENSKLGRHLLEENSQELGEKRNDFRSVIDVSVVGGEAWSADVFGHERTGPHAKELRDDPAWPKDMVPRAKQPGMADKRPRKALGHGAVTLVRWPPELGLDTRVAARWAAFLPLEVAYHVDRQQSLAKHAGAPAALDLVLHGYFFPKPDRKGLEGLTEGVKSKAGEWNRGLAKSLTLPLIPKVLAMGSPRDMSIARSVVAASAQALASLHSEFEDVTAEASFAPIIGDAGTRYEAVARAALDRIRLVHAWGKCESVVWLRREILDAAKGCDVLIVDDEFVVPRFLSAHGSWQPAEFRTVLGKLTPRDKAAPADMEAAYTFVVQTFPAPAKLGDVAPTSTAALQWLQALQAKGWGPLGRRWLDQDTGGQLAARLIHWAKGASVVVAEVSRGARPAVERLAGSQLPRILLAPTGTETTATADSAVTAACIELLPEVVARIAAAERGEKGSGEIGPKAWKLLARDLVRLVGLEEVRRHPDLKDLPLIPVWQPGIRGETLLSAGTLEERARRGLVFSVPPGQDEESEAASVAAALRDDDKRLLESLAGALIADVALPCVVQVDDLNFKKIVLDSVGATLVANADRLQSSFAARSQLFGRLCEDHAFSAERCKAVRLAAHGRGDKAAAQETLYILPADGSVQLAATAYLRQRELAWTIVSGKVRDSTSGESREFLEIQELLESTILDWLRQAPSAVSVEGMSDAERIAMLGVVAGSRDKDLFFALPLHKSMRSTASAATYVRLAQSETFRSGIDIPAEVETGVTIISSASDDRVQWAYEHWLSEFNDRALLEVLLRQEYPHRHWRLILETLARPHGNVVPLAAMFADMRDRLGTVHWLPIGSPERGAALCDVVDDLECSSEVKALLNDLLRQANGLRTTLMTSLAETGRADFRSLIRHLYPSRTPVSALCDTIQRSHLVLPPTWVTLPVRHGLTVQAVALLCEHKPLSLARRGWELADAAREWIASQGQEGQSVDAGRQVVEALLAAMGPDDWAATLNAVVPQDKDDDAKKLREVWFQLAELIPSHDIAAVLPALTVLCANNKWQNAKQVAKVSLGVPQSRAPHDQIARWLHLGEEDEVLPKTRLTDDTLRPLSCDDVVSYIEKWVGGTIHRHVLGVVFSLTGSSEMSSNAQIWLDDTEVDIPRRQLTAAGLDPFSGKIPVEFFKSTTKSNQIRVPNLCGEFITITAGTEAKEALLEGDARREVLERRVSPTLVTRSPKVTIVLRECNFRLLDAQLRNRILHDTAESFALAVLGREAFANLSFDSWWRTWGVGSQTDIWPARALLLSDLPSKLAEFRIGDVGGLADLKAILQRMQRARYEGATANSDVERSKADGKFRAEETAFQHQLANPKVGSLLRRQVRTFLDEYAYSSKSVLLELIQNADDALEQLAAMNPDGTLPTAARKVRIQLLQAEGAASPSVIFTHWGRPINDHGGRKFPKGKDLQWDQDLYFMARFQVSAKHGDGERGEVRSTGKFGLGFKSVHLISDEPEVWSGTLAFRLEAALLPARIRDDSLRPDADEINGLLPTTIRLPLRVDEEPQVLLDQVFARVSSIAAFIPLMARQIVEIELPETRGGRVGYSSDSLGNLEGWTLGSTECFIGKSSKPIRLLRFRPAGSMRSLAIAIHDGVPVAVADEVPTFWVVAPTDECWQLGYCVNGDFKLDTGRTRVDFRSRKSRSELAEFGQQLGRALVDLCEAVLGDPQVCQQLRCLDLVGFVAALWRVLAGGLGSKVGEDRLSVVKELHAGGRGLGFLSGNLTCIPSGMPKPWPQLVGPIRQQENLGVATDAALSPAVLPLLDLIPELIGTRPVVEHNIADVLSRIAQVREVEFSVSRQLQNWTAARGDEITPELADLLQPLVRRECWEAIEEEAGCRSGSGSPLQQWAKTLKVRCADGGTREIAKLLVPQLAANRAAELSDKRDSFHDEVLRAAFAPNCAVLAPEYAERPNRLDVFVRLRGELDADAATLAKWAHDATTRPIQLAVCTYLGKGILARELAQAIRKVGPLSWAATPDSWQTIAAEAKLHPDHAKVAEIELFGAPTVTQLLQTLFPQPPRPLDAAEAKSRLEYLWQQWSQHWYRDKRLNERRKQLWPKSWARDEIKAWLNGSLDEPHTRKAWLTLFLLAHVQSLGMQAGQHQGFVESLLYRRSRTTNSTWWDRLFGMGAPDGTWTDFLDEWSRTRVSGYRAYDHWMRVLPDMYAATKWWRSYAESLKMGQVGAATDELLAPSANPALSGDFDSAEVPAMVGAMKRLPWMISELEYFGVISNRLDGLNPKDGYMPSPELTKILDRLGFFADQGYRDYTSRDVHNWLSNLITEEKADFHGLCATPLEIDADLLLKP
jgi:hypothetical protein